MNARILILLLCTVAIQAKWAAGAEPSKPPLQLADFSSQAGLHLRQEGAEAEVVELGGNQILEIATTTESSYPGVTLVPQNGPWELSEYEMVEVDIVNPQEHPVRVLLSVISPAPDGKQYDNTESLQVPAGSKATLSLPFGAWHGETGRPIDQQRITAVRVFLDRPQQAHRFLVDNIRAVVYDRAAVEELFAKPFYQQLKTPLGRGINLGNALEAPREGEWGVTLREEYFEAIAAAGFDHVRLPVRWSAHAEHQPPFRIDPKFWKRVDWAVQQALSRDLQVVLNVHHYEEVMKQPAGHSERFLALWEQIGEHYRDQGDGLLFELLNEPQDKLDAQHWNRLLAEALQVVRRSNPTRLVVVGPAGFNSIALLPHLQLPDDEHLIVTVHYYSPFNFTHQGAHWLGNDAERWVGTTWTGTAVQQRAVQRDLDAAIRWGIEHRRPIYLGEFGAFEQANLASRARWTEYVASEALQRKIGFAYWEFCSGFGAYDPKTNEWIEPLRDALLP